MPELSESRNDGLENLRVARVNLEGRASPIPGDLRPLWRLATIVLMLQRCRGESATTKQLQALSWSLTNDDAGAAMRRGLQGGARAIWFSYRFEPILNQALTLAIGERLVAHTGSGRYQLTTSGKTLAQLIRQDEECMRPEKDFLDSLPGGKLTQKAFHELLP